MVVVVVWYDRKILGLGNSKLQQQQFLAYRLLLQRQVVGRGGHLGIATTQHIIYTSKNSKSIYHAAAPLHRVVRNIGAPTLSCQKAAWAMRSCQIILAFVRNCKSIYIALEMFSEKLCILSELQESLVCACMRCAQLSQFYFIILLFYVLYFIVYSIYPIYVYCQKALYNNI